MQLPTQDRQTATTRSDYVLALYSAFSLAAFLLAASRGDVDLYSQKNSVSGVALLHGPALGLAIGVVVVVLSRLAVRQFRWARHLHREFHALLGDLGPRDILILALASSIGEELFFRGALMPWLGVWAQAGLFGILHVGPGKRFLPWTLSALVVGLGFGYLTIWTGNLGAAIAAHFTINYLNLRYIVGTKLAPESPAS